MFENMDFDFEITQSVLTGIVVGILIIVTIGFCYGALTANPADMTAVTIARLGGI